MIFVTKFDNGNPTEGYFMMVKHSRRNRDIIVYGEGGEKKIRQISELEGRTAVAIYALVDFNNIKQKSKTPMQDLIAGCGPIATGRARCDSRDRCHISKRAGIISAGRTAFGCLRLGFAWNPKLRAYVVLKGKKIIATSLSTRKAFCFLGAL